MKSNLKILILLIFIIPFILSSSRGCAESFIGGANERRCSVEDKMEKLEIKGVVTRVYIDSANHNYRKVNYRNQTGELVESLLFHIDGSGLFDQLMIGDTLTKEKNTLNVVAKRDSIILFDGLLDYDCHN